MLQLGGINVAMKIKRISYKKRNIYKEYGLVKTDQFSGL